MKKKLICFICSTVMAFALMACGEEAAPAASVEESVQVLEESDAAAENIEESVEETEEEIAQVHEHTFEVVSNEDGTHTTKCTGEGCDEETTENCTFNDEYVCEVCGFQHEHTIEIVSNDDKTHTQKCTTEYCDYEVVEDCENVKNVCPTCGYNFPIVKKAVNVDVTHYNGTSWTTPVYYNSYDSIDEACIAIIGLSWSDIKATWTLQDDSVILGDWALSYYHKDDNMVSIRNGRPDSIKTSTESYWFTY